MHIGKVAERIQGASRRFRRRFESRRGHFLSKTQISPELDGTLRNQVRKPPTPPPPQKKTILTVFWL